MSHDEILAVVQAHKEGKQIQVRSIFVEDGEGWRDCGTPQMAGLSIPSFDFSRKQYRVKSEPRKPMEAWIHRDPKNGVLSVVGFQQGERNHCPHCVLVREVIEEGQ